MVWGRLLLRPERIPHNLDSRQRNRTYGDHPCPALLYQTCPTTPACLFLVALLEFCVRCTVRAIRYAAHLAHPAVPYDLHGQLFQSDWIDPSNSAPTCVVALYRGAILLLLAIDSQKTRIAKRPLVRDRRHLLRGSIQDGIVHLVRRGTLPTYHRFRWRYSRLLDTDSRRHDFCRLRAGSGTQGQSAGTRDSRCSHCARGSRCS